VGFLNTQKDACIPLNCILQEHMYFSGIHASVAFLLHLQCSYCSIATASHSVFLEYMHLSNSHS
jgi:hypothetical protein